MNHRNDNFIKIPFEMPNIENKNINEPNKYFQSFLNELGESDYNFIKNNFQLNGHIKLNQYIIDPLSLPTLRRNLNKIGMETMTFFPDGIIFFFKDFLISFIGSFSIIKNRKYFCIEIDYKVGLIEDKLIPIYENIINELKNFDSLYYFNKLKIIENIEQQVKKDCLL